MIFTTLSEAMKNLRRSFEEFNEKLALLGAQIEKVSDEKELQKFILKVS